MIWSYERLVFCRILPQVFLPKRRLVLVVVEEDSAVAAWWTTVVRVVVVVDVVDGVLFRFG